MAYNEDFQIIIDAVNDAIDSSGMSVDEFEKHLEELSSRVNDSTKESASLYQGLVFNTPTLAAINAKRYGRPTSYLSAEYLEVGCKKVGVKSDDEKVWIAQKRFQKPPRKVDENNDYIMVDGQYQVYEFSGSFFDIFKLGKTLKEGLIAVAKFRAAKGANIKGCRVGKPEKVKTAYNGEPKNEFVYPIDFITKTGEIYEVTEDDKRKAKP